MALLDDILAMQGLGGAPGSFPLLPQEQLDPAAEAQAAREAAAARLAAGVRSPQRAAAAQPAFGPFPGLLGLEMTGMQPTAPGNMTPAAAPVIDASVPLPRPRPAEADAPFDITPGDAALPPNATPTSGPAPFSMAPARPGFFDKLLSPDHASTLLALGSGFAGAPSIGTGMRRAFGNAAPYVAMSEKRDEVSRVKNQTVRALMAKGMSEAEATAAASNPTLLASLLKQIHGGDTPAGYKKTETGLSFIPGGPADPAVKRALGDRTNAPPGYRFKNPEDPASDLVAISGGPAEKVDANVAARIGLADSFLGQLPSIRKRINEGQATGPVDGPAGYFGIGEAGELRRQVASGSEALLRNLTGAGMNEKEASDYVARYHLQPHETKWSANSKLDQLERELKATKEAVGRGRGGSHLPVPDAPRAPAAPRITSTGIKWSME